MILVFDLGGPLLAYTLLRSGGMGTVAALIISGIFPILGIAIGALVDRRLDIIGVVVLAGLVVGTVLGLISNNARLYLVEGAVPSLVFALACLGSLRASKPLIYRFAVELLGQDTPQGPRRHRCLAVSRIPAGVPGHHRGLGRRLPRRGRGAPGGRGDHLDRDRAAVLQAGAVRLRPGLVGLDTGLRRAREEEGRATGRGRRRGPRHPAAVAADAER